MPYDFNAFSPLTNTATEITFTGLNTMAPFNVRIKGSGLAYNPATGVLTGTVTSIERYNGAFVPEVTTLGAGAAVKISTFLQASLQVIADTITAWGIAFDNVNGTFGPGGTLLTLELTSASVVIGYLRLAGTGLTDAGFDSGHITSITHLDATQTAVAGHVKTYAGVGLLAACFDYGLQSTNGGVSGNGEAIYPTIISGNDTITPAAGTNGGVLEGGDGNDTYVLGAGSYSIDDTSGTDTVTSTITRSLATFTSIEKLTLAGAAAINGTGN
ncbi:MAG: hypothetical protein ABL907_16220, partial [Hyphomicrobium sp.]